jgi:hypothetical protein
MTSSEGPSILWEQLKGKKVRTNDGRDLGEVKDVTKNYILLEKGVINKDKVWVPKYVVDAYDGKVLWLLVSNEDIAKGYLYGEEPAVQQYTRDFETFKTRPYGQKAVYLPDFQQNIRMTEERRSPPEAGDSYKNIREVE